MKNKTFSKILRAAALGLLAAVLVWLISKYVAADLFYSVEAKTYDWRVKKHVLDRDENDVIEDIVVKYTKLLI